jgi:hypothetical protein
MRMDGVSSSNRIVLLSTLHRPVIVVVDDVAVIVVEDEGTCPLNHSWIWEKGEEDIPGFWQQNSNGTDSGAAGCARDDDGSNINMTDNTSSSGILQDQQRKLKDRKLPIVTVIEE